MVIGSGRMPQFCLPPLPESAAQGAVSTLWLCLERNHLRTPDLHMEFDGADGVRITVTSRGPQRAVTVFRSWAQEWGCADTANVAELNGA